MRESCAGHSGCGSCCGHCGGCGELILTPMERDILYRLAELPFLPVGFASENSLPIFRELPGESEMLGAALASLGQKQLVSVDAEIPLAGCDYQDYGDCPIRGSIALTARGQQVIELLERQGVTEETC